MLCLSLSLLYLNKNSPGQPGELGWKFSVSCPNPPASVHSISQTYCYFCSFAESRVSPESSFSLFATWQHCHSGPGLWNEAPKLCGASFQQWCFLLEIICSLSLASDVSFWLWDKFISTNLTCEPPVCLVLWYKLQECWWIVLSCLTPVFHFYFAISFTSLLNHL